MTKLVDVTFRGNPFALADPNNLTAPKDRDQLEYFTEVLKRLPSVETLDGIKKHHVLNIEEEQGPDDN